MALTNVQQLEVDKEVKKAKQELENGMVSYQKINELTGFKTEMISIMHKTIAKGTTISELAYFLTYSKSIGLNPLNKEIWCYKDGRDNVIIFTGRDGFLKKNKENPLYRGMRSSEVCEFDEFEIDMIEGVVQHKISNNRGKVISGYAVVSIEGQRDTIVYLDFEEFDLKQAKWKTAPKMMIKKCAQSHALKEAAGLTGIQVEEAYVIKNDIAVSVGEDKKEEINYEEDRLIQVIEGQTSIEGLKKLLNHCTTPDAIEAYDKKMSSLL